MMKIAALATLLAGSASAFTPSISNGRVSTAIAAEKSQALPFMNRPPLVSPGPWTQILSGRVDIWVHTCIRSRITDGELSSNGDSI